MRITGRVAPWTEDKPDALQNVDHTQSLTGTDKGRRVNIDRCVAL
jgi:hypothetical protein